MAQHDFLRKGLDFAHVIILALVVLVLRFSAVSAFQQPVVEKAVAQDKDVGWEAFNRKSFDELIQDLEQYPGWLTVIQRLRVLDDKRAIEPLRRAFTRVEGKREKQVIAATLLSLGAIDQEYFDYLAGFAREVAESDVPFPLALDEQGNPVPKQLSEAFVSWCQEKGLEPVSTSHLVVFEWPGELMPLVLARDPRAVSIFLSAIRSHNVWVVYQGIQGLAVLEHSEAIPAIIEAIKRIPPEFRQSCALPLSLFENPVAQRALDRWVQDKRLIPLFRESRARMIPGLAPPE